MERDLSPDEIHKRILELGDWFQNINLRGVWTAPGHYLGDYPTVKWSRFSRALPTDLSGKTVLDVGCKVAGFLFDRDEAQGGCACHRNRS